MGLLEGLIAASVGAGLGLLALRWRPWAAQLERATALAIAVLALALLWPGLQGATGWCVTLYSGAGCAGLVARPPGLYLAVIAFVTLGLVQLLPGKRADSATGGLGLGHLLTGLVAAGVTVDHMLMRFVLVELAVLPTLALLLVDGNRGLALWRNIGLLRVAGDLFLLLILGLFGLASIWAIDAMLALVEEGSAAQLWPVLACGLFVVWIKVGLPPAAGWIRDAIRGRPQAYILTAGTGLPVLGAYLLYRLRPMILATQGQYLVLGPAGMALAWALLRPRAAWGARLLEMTGALFIGLAATPLAAWYLPVLALARVIILAGPDPGLAPSTGRLEAMGQRAVDAARGVARVLQREHTGLLNRNLIWACAGMAALVVMGLMLSQGGGF